MRVPLSWLKEYLEGQIDDNIIADSLTMAGLEVAALENIDRDKVLEIEVTPNRSDCLSIIGIAREVKAIFDLKLKKPVFNIEKELKGSNFNIIIANSELCYRYAARIVKGIKVGPSPEWLKERIEKCGIRSINNIVDITNYVLLEYGHPLHAFDLDLLEGNCIRVGTPADFGKEEEEMETLDGVKRKLSREDLLIWDGIKPIAIAGVMGGANTEVTDKTKNIIIESAYFKTESIRRTSKRLGLITEASYRFERGTDIEALIEALDRAAFLIKEIAGGDIYEILDVYPKKIPQVKISFSTQKLSQFIGVNLKEDEIINILNRLHIKVYKEGDFYIAHVPSHRQDLSMPEDIAEEVARIFGYDKIPAELPQVFKPVFEDVESSKKRRFLRSIRNFIINLGFNEAVNFSFISPEELNIFEIPENDLRRKYVSLLNPLRQEESILRTMLMPGLLRNVERNTSRGIDSVRVFEIGKVFFKNDETILPTEDIHLGIIVKKEEDYKNPFKEDPYDFFALKGVLDGLFRHLKIENLLYHRSKESFLHKGQSADIFVKGDKIGFIGIISPRVLSKYDFKTKPHICMAEINLEKLFSIHSKNCSLNYKPFSMYPPVKRDTALLISKDFEAQKLLDLIKKYGSDLIEDFYIFDIYKGKGIPEGKQNIAFRVIYRAFDRTLKSEEVTELHTKLIERIISETGAEIRS